MYLIFDTETTGLPKRLMHQLQMQTIGQDVLEIAWQLRCDGSLIEHQDFLIKPDGFKFLSNRNKFMVFLQPLPPLMVNHWM